MNTEGRIKGIAASEGIAIGPAYQYQPQELTIPAREPESGDSEISRFSAAVTQARQELTGIRDRMLERVGEEDAAIFDAHILMLDDPMLAQSVQDKVGQGMLIEQAVLDAANEISAMLAGMEDEYFAARALDVQDVGRRVLRILLGIPDTALDSLEAPSIIIAHDLTPSDTASLSPELTLGFCTAVGGMTSHTAILARTLGIPAIVGAGKDIEDKILSGETVIIDGTNGELIQNPSDATIATYKEMKHTQETWLSSIQEIAAADAHTADGKRVEVAANIGEVESAKDALAFGAEGVGLLRTEFLYLNDVQQPSEEKQVAIYKQIFEKMGDRPVIVRTLDIGGDKPPSFLEFEEELNPFLGWRAIRICLELPDLFKAQLRGILRAAVGYNISIMFPMISGLDELKQSKAVLKEVMSDMQEEGIEYAKDVPIGIMVETPAAATLVDVFAEESEFFSIGTNDLTQYTLAVDRGNEKVAELYQPLHPAVLRLIKTTIDLAHEKGRWVGVCGELAGMRKAIPILLGLGLDEFSMVPRAIPEAKWLINKLSVNQARLIAEKALGFGTAAEVEVYMDEVLGEIIV